MRRGFSLVELLVVLGVVAVLLAIMLPALAGSRRGARATACLANLSQVGIALGLYRGDYHDLIPYADRDASAGEYDRPFTELEPYLGAPLPRRVGPELVRSKAYECPDDREIAPRTGYSYVYRPYAWMADWTGPNPQQAISVEFRNTPDEIIVMDNASRHGIPGRSCNVLSYEGRAYSFTRAAR